MSLRTVLVGAASRVAGPCHRLALARVPQIEVVGYCDTDADLLAGVGAEDGVAKLFRDFDEVCSDDVRPEHMRAQETMVDWGGDLSTL